jgi:hypothetical protein
MSALGFQRKRRTPLWRGLLLVLALVPALCQALCLPPQGPGTVAQNAPAAEDHNCHGMAMAAQEALSPSHESADPGDHGDCCDPSAPAPSSEADPVPEMLLAGLMLSPAVASESSCYKQAAIRGPPVSTGPPLTLLHCHFTE